MREIAVNPSSFVRGTPLPAWFHRQAQLPEATSHEPLITRLADSHFRVGAPATTVVHRAIQVNEASALPEVGQYPIAFQPDYQRVELHWLKVYRGTQVIDRLEGASVRFYHTERSVDQGIYTGSISAVVITQDVRPGDTLELIYSLIGENPVFGGRYAEAAGWDNFMPVLKRRVTLDLPKGRTVRHRVVGENGNAVPVAVETDVGDRHLVRYEGSNLAPVDPESLVPPDVQAARWIQFSEYRDWRDVGRWASGLFEVKDAASLALPADVAAAPSKTEAVIRALQFVQDNIRYLSISIGENSHRPYPPDEVLARRYGDCKDKTLLLVTLLRRLGIPAEPVLISTQTRKGLRILLPSPALFDHAIVRATVDGRIYYLDPTLQGQASTLERLGQTFPGADAFVVGSDSLDLESIPVTRANDTPISRRIERVLARRLDEAAEMQIEFSYGAEDAEAMRRALSRYSPAQVRKAYEGILDRRYPQAELLADPKISDDRGKNLLVVEVRYRIPNFFEKQGGRWNVRYEAANLTDLLPLPNNAKRRFPMFLAAYPWAGHYSFEVTLPEDYDGRYRPERRTLQSEAFRLDELLSFSGRQLKAEVDLVLSKDRIAATGTPQFLEDLRKANGFFRGSLYIQDQDRRTAAANIPLKELSRQRLEQALNNTGNAIAAAKSAGRETATARCEHALAAAYLDRLEVAREDADNAVNEQPTSADTLRCRGTVRFISGDFEGSIRDLTRALALGNTDADTYFHRGLAHFYTQHWAQAAEDFNAFGARTDEERGQARAAVWSTLAKRQAGQSAPSGKVQTAAWPAPVLGVLQGEATVEDIIERLNRSESGAKLEEALAEGYFYFYQHFASSNRVKSQAFLKRALELGPLYSLVQVAARHETRRINAIGR